MTHTWGFFCIPPTRPARTHWDRFILPVRENAGMNLPPSHLPGPSPVGSGSSRHRELVYMQGAGFASGTGSAQWAVGQEVPWLLTEQPVRRLGVGGSQRWGPGPWEPPQCCAPGAWWPCSGCRAGKKHDWNCDHRKGTLAVARDDLEGTRVQAGALGGQHVYLAVVDLEGLSREAHGLRASGSCILPAAVQAGMVGLRGEGAACQGPLAPASALPAVAALPPSHSLCRAGPAPGGEGVISPSLRSR